MPNENVSLNFEVDNSEGTITIPKIFVNLI